MMAGEFTANFGTMLMILLCPRNTAFLPGVSIRSAGSRLREDRAPRMKPPRIPHISTQPRRNEFFVRRIHSNSNKHQSVMCDENASDNWNSNSDFDASDKPPPSASPKTPSKQPLTSIRIRFLRGGTPGDLAGAPPMRHLEPDSFVEVSLNQSGDVGEGRGGHLDDPRDLGDFLFLARSSQPGSIGHGLQRRGFRFFPKEAFVDPVLGSVGQDPAAKTAVAAEDIRYNWETGTPLPQDMSMDDLPRDEKGRARLVLWDPCGPDHPLIRAVEADPVEEASVEVLNFPQPGKGDGSEFDELRSAVVFKRWFTVDQQKAIADALGDQIIDDDEPGLATDRTHVPLINERAALAAVGDGMLAALSSERFSEAVEGRAPPVHVGANRDFTAVCYGNRAKMDKHRDTWKEWTLIVSIGNNISFELGTRSEGPQDVAFELASGEGLLFNGHDLFHAVTGVKKGTAPEFWKHHPLSSEAAFARVGLLSLKGFSTKGASPRWGTKGSGRGGDRVRA